MALQDVARALLEQIGAPIGAALVIPWHEDDGRVVLVVQIDRNAGAARTRVPADFRGYPVRIEDLEIPVVH